MNRRTLALLLMMAALAGGAMLRLADLANRPMHADEAVQALKFGRLLEGDGYVYDPHEYHGPALNYLTLPIAWLAGARRLTQITEAQLRLLPALLGLALVALPWLLRDGLGRTSAACAAVLTAASPALAFYARFYISETLLACFTFAAIAGAWRYVRAAQTKPERASDQATVSSGLGRAGWLVLAGFCVGLMYAAKETSAIALFAMLLAAGLTAAWAGPVARQALRLRVREFGTAAGVLLFVAAAVALLLFSSFFSNPRGVVDSVAAYGHYVGRGLGRHDAAWHAHPWHYYLRILLWSHAPGGAVWTEATILLLAAVGFVGAARRKGLGGANVHLVRFLGIYTLGLAVIYSALPYKTPWCMLGFLHGMILLAGVGAAVLVRAAPGRAVKVALVGLMLAALAHLSWQAWRASFVDYEDPGNPYAYVQATSDVLLLTRRIEDVAEAHPAGLSMPIQVICPGNDYWPLPWYLRAFGRTGWLERVPDGPLAPLLILKPEVEPALVARLFGDRPPGERALYVDLLADLPGGEVELRPNVPLRAFVRADLWEAYAARGASGQAAPRETGK